MYIINIDKREITEDTNEKNESNASVTIKV
jgi:hypothetical protein